MGGIEVSSELNFPAGIGGGQLKVPQLGQSMKEEKLGSGVWGPRGLDPSLSHQPGLWGLLPPLARSIRPAYRERAPSRDHRAGWGFLLTVAIATIYQT